MLGLLIDLVNRLLTHVGNRYAVILCFYVESLRRSGSRHTTNCSISPELVQVRLAREWTPRFAFFG